MLCGSFSLFSSGCLSSSGPVYGMEIIVDDRERGLGLDAETIGICCIYFVELEIKDIVFH